MIFLLKILLKSASKSSFFRSGVEIHPVLKLQFPTPLRVVLLCFATHIVMAASRLLHAVAACVILLSFAAGLRKSYWSGYMNFLHFGASDFPSKNAFKKCFKIFFFSLWRRDPVLKLQFPTPLRVVLLCFATHIVMAASRLLHAVAACVILLSFAAGLRKSYWSGCMKAATVICQQIFSILALVIFLLKILLKSASKSSFFRSGVEIRFWSYNFRRHCA